MSWRILERAMLLMQQGRMEQADEQLRQFLAQDPQEPVAHALLALCLADRDALDEATREAELAVHHGPDQALSHHAMARVMLSRHRLPEARRAIDEAIRLDPEDAAYHAIQCEILLAERNWQGALDAAVLGLSIDPGHAGCGNLRVIALRQLGRAGEAQQAVDRLLAESPESSTAHANQGWSLVESGQPRQALEHFREALRLDPENEWAQSGMMTALKARNPVYRWVLNYFVAMGRLSNTARWAVIIGLYVAARYLNRLADAHPALAPWVTPFLLLYVIFVLLSWSANPLFNLMLRLNRYGRHLLSDEEIRASNLVGLCLLLAVISLALGFIIDASLWLAALYFFVMIVPLSATTAESPGRRRTVLAVYTAVLAVSGAAGSCAIFAGYDAIGVPALAVFFLGVLFFSWVANALSMRLERR